MKNKRKSVVAFIIAICFMLPTMFLLSACGKHEHKFSNTWSKSETQHWHECTDKNCNEKQDLADHDFVWTEKTPAGVHKDKVETGTCSTCQYQKDRTVEGSGANIHSWEWKANEHKHWQQTTCEHETPLKQNEENHTWVYTSEGELTHRRTTNCGAEKHPSRTEINIAHRYDNVDDTTCNDCDYVRSLTGKGSFNEILAKTYNAGEQGVALGDYRFDDEAIKDLCEIQYKVKGANDSTYTTTKPTNAGTYEVRIYCRGNATYLRGEVAKTEFVIKQYEINLGRVLTYEVAYNKTAMEDSNVQYINLGTVNKTDGLVRPVDVVIKVLKTNTNKNPGRIQINYSSLLTDDDNFKIRQYSSGGSAIVKVTLVHYNDSVAATLTSGAAESVEWDTTGKRVGIAVTSVNNGTIRVGDYMMCEGYIKPLKVVDIKLKGNAFTNMLVHGDSNCKVYFDYSSFTDSATAKPILANKTFTEVETLNFVEGQNYTNTVSRQLGKGECFYLAFTTDESTIDKSYKLNFDTNGTGYETSGSVYFFGTDGYTDVSGITLTVKHEEIYFVKVTKTANSDAGKESVDFYISKW